MPYLVVAAGKESEENDCPLVRLSVQVAADCRGVARILAEGGAHWKCGPAPEGRKKWGGSGGSPGKIFDIECQILHFCIYFIIFHSTNDSIKSQIIV